MHESQRRIWIFERRIPVYISGWGGNIIYALKNVFDISKINDRSCYISTLLWIIFGRMTSLNITNMYWKAIYKTFYINMKIAVL